MRSWLCFLLMIAAAACGSRTGLLVSDENTQGGPGAGAAEDSGAPALDATRADDSAAKQDRDALPPLDVAPTRDAARDEICDGGQTFIYVVTEEFGLMSFYPPTGQFAPIGTLHCPVAGTPSPDNTPIVTPFSMAVDRTGIAYVLYSDGELFRVSTATASCQRTRFVSGQQGFASTFGMSFSKDTQGSGETLFVASGGTNPHLATIDPTGFALRVVGPLQPPVESAELTGTGAGDLFAFYATNGAVPCDNSNQNVTCPDSAIGQIDKTTGRVTNQSVLFGNAQRSAWAFAFWGGDFYTFTAAASAMDSPTIVSRFRPTDGSITVAARTNDSIVGAGVSTCAPAE